MDRSQDYYEQDSLWGKEPLPYQVRVKDDVLSLLPPDIESVLDIGCGDGFITNALPESLRVVGMDTSEEALKYVKRETKLGALPRTEFADNSFDLVMANDVIEHLPRSVFREGMREIERIAAKYVIITVPLLEDLRAACTRCGACGRVYHVNHHQQSFGVVELANLFEGRLVAQVFIFSGAEVDPVTRLQGAFRARLGALIHSDTALCPYCGARASVQSVSDEVLGSIDTLAQQLPSVQSWLYPNRSECIALFALGREAENADSEKAESNPALQLLCEDDGRPTLVLSSLHAREEGLVIKCSEPESCGQDRSVWLQWECGAVSYRCSNPRRLSATEFVVPPWFNLESIEQLSVSRLESASVDANELLRMTLNYHVRHSIRREAELINDLENAKAELEKLRFFRGLKMMVGSTLEALRLRKRRAVNGGDSAPSHNGQ